jgi:fumarylpyruvate hydrolase
MTEYLFPPPAIRSLPVLGETTEYPVHRILCIGRNYADHAKEMGSVIDKSTPFFFTKSLTAFAATGQTLPYPPGTSDYQHEVELVVAIGAPAFRVAPDQAMDAVLGYAVGLDMTRRDLQAVSKEKRHPWDTAKDVEGSAVVGPLTRAPVFGLPGPQRMVLTVNGVVRQDTRLSEMVWSVPEIIAILSMLYHLAPGDLIFTGTPAGVGPVLPGDRLVGQIGGLTKVVLEIEAQHQP